MHLLTFLLLATHTVALLPLAPRAGPGQLFRGKLKDHANDSEVMFVIHYCSSIPQVSIDPWCQEATYLLHLLYFRRVAKLIQQQVLAGKELITPAFQEEGTLLVSWP